MINLEKNTLREEEKLA